VLAAVEAGAIRLLYIAPERFRSAEFTKKFRKLPVALFAVDEAHCVSHWGHDFRPDYLTLKEAVGELPSRPAVLACTATATSEVKSDIITQLRLRSPEIVVRGFDRPNLTYVVAQGLTESDRELFLKRVTRELSGSGIVYAGTRARSEKLAAILRKQGVNAQSYHAGMKPEERKRTQEEFMNDTIRVIVATVAFGMGIDKPDVRFVIHAQMPGSLESYYQEAGRAGRDGKPAYCILLHAWKDRALQDYFIEAGFKEMVERGKPKKEATVFSELRRTRLEYMQQYSTARTCRRHQILAYFDDPDAERLQTCQGCDVCLSWYPTNSLPRVPVSSFSSS
jgi:ATP-dependent DNA helicase RecQ